MSITYLEEEEKRTREARGMKSRGEEECSRREKRMPLLCVLYSVNSRGSPVQGAWEPTILGRDEAGRSAGSPRGTATRRAAAPPLRLRSAAHRRRRSASRAATSLRAASRVPFPRASLSAVAAGRCRSRTSSSPLVGVPRPRSLRPRRRCRATTRAGSARTRALLAADDSSRPQSDGRRCSSPR